MLGPVDFDAFEAVTGDQPGNPQFPWQTAAPTDPDAAAPGDPFVHAVVHRSRPAEPLVRFWFPTEAYPSELRIDVEILADRYDEIPATLRTTAQLIAVAFFHYTANGFYRSQGVERLHLRDIRTGERLAGPHP